MLKLADAKTTILVTHNMYQALSVNNVVVMSNGVIIEQGRPGELLDSGGQFASMFREFNGEMPFKFEDDLSKTDLGDISVRLPSVKLRELEITRVRE